MNTEKSIIDYFIVCKNMFKRIIKMKIDDERKFTLTKYSTTKGNKSVKESDHNPIIAEFNLTVECVRKESREMFNLKNIKCHYQIRLNELSQALHCRQKSHKMSGL